MFGADGGRRSYMVFCRARLVYCAARLFLLAGIRDQEARLRKTGGLRRGYNERWEEGVYIVGGALHLLRDGVFFLLDWLLFLFSSFFFCLLWFPFCALYVLCAAAIGFASLASSMRP